MGSAAVGQPARVRDLKGPADGLSPRYAEVTSEYRALAAEYATLSDKYLWLVARHHALIERRNGPTLLALWASRASGLGLAAVRDGAFLARNAAWFEISRREGSPWRRVSPAPNGETAPVTYRDIDHLAVGEAERMARARQGAPRDTAFERDDGQALWVRMERMSLPRAKPLWVVMVSDVTARVCAERELQRVREQIAEQQRLRDLGELASGVAHDLNNALHALRLRLVRLASDPEIARTNEETLRAIDRIVDDAVERVVQLQDDAHNRCGERASALELKSVIEDAVELCRPGFEAGAGGATVRIELDIASIPKVRGSPGELRHAFVNLILNARDAMPAGGTVAIAARAERNQVEVTVSDDGTGIPPALLPCIFDPFATTKGRRRTGLGLAQVRRAMQGLGGSISAENGSRGGAVFRLVFPVAASREVPRSSEPTSVPAPPRQRVLVVDDDPDNLDALRWVLESLGQEVEVATSGDDALARIGAGRDFALALCDVGMPGMSGWEVAGRIRERSPSTHVVLLTGWARDLATDPQRARVDGILSKPVDLPMLRAVLSGRPPPDPLEASRAP